MSFLYCFSLSFYFLEIVWLFIILVFYYLFCLFLLSRILLGITILLQTISGIFLGLHVTSDINSAYFSIFFSFYLEKYIMDAVYVIFILMVHHLSFFLYFYILEELYLMIPPQRRTTRANTDNRRNPARGVNPFVACFHVFLPTCPLNRTRWDALSRFRGSTGTSTSCWRSAWNTPRQSALRPAKQGICSGFLWCILLGC